MTTITTDSDNASARFTTFGGVFTPCTLTILGVIMYLRLGHIVGRSGLYATLGIVLAATLITLLTTLSLSAIATNTRVKGGGAYFLISRSLGVEFGGAVGIVFYIAQAISVSLYSLGFAEALAYTFGVTNTTQIATVVNVIVFVCVFIGAGWTIRIQYGILAILGASLASFFIGSALHWNMAVFQSNIQPQFTDTEGLFTMFALFFPAVTGIMAGANMSGDLKDPAKSIPAGTLTAVGVTCGMYLLIAVMFSGSTVRPDLIDGSLVMEPVALIPWLITFGVFAATLSSALGSMMGAPRILQAFAKDDVFSAIKILGRGSGPTNEPRIATVLTFLIAQTCIFAGGLDDIAPVITMAFLITYGILNLATFYEAVTRNPSYRPRFRFCHWSLSLVGAILCVAVMFLIAPLWAAVSIVAVGLLHLYIGGMEIKQRWGDLQSGLFFSRARRNLLKLED